MKAPSSAVALALVTTLALVACGSDDDSTPAGAAGTSAGGGPVSGAADAHCDGQPVVTVDPAACTATGDDGDEGGDAGAGGTSDCTLAHDPDYGDTRFGTSADDDDCKYHASYVVSPVARNQPVTFTVTATNKSDGSPLVSSASLGQALSRVELYVPCDPTHLPPDSDVSAPIVDDGGGTFTAGPYVFDEPGRWVVRFHFFEQCADADGSPHGHVAFFLDVP